MCVARVIWLEKSSIYFVGSMIAKLWKKLKIHGSKIVLVFCVQLVGWLTKEVSCHLILHVEVIFLAQLHCIAVQFTQMSTPKKDSSFICETYTKLPIQNLSTYIGYLKRPLASSPIHLALSPPKIAIPNYLGTTPRTLTWHLKIGASTALSFQEVRHPFLSPPSRWAKRIQL